MLGTASGLQETETPFLKIHTKCHVLQAPVQRKQFERTRGRIHSLILEPPPKEAKGTCPGDRIWQQSFGEAHSEVKHWVWKTPFWNPCFSLLALRSWVHPPAGLHQPPCSLKPQNAFQRVHTHTEHRQSRGKTQPHPLAG